MIKKIIDFFKALTKKEIKIYGALAIAVLIIIGGGISMGTYIHSQKRSIHELQGRVLELEDELSRAILNEPDFFFMTPAEGLIEALRFYDVKEPEIVYAQAVLESGNFKSGLAVYGNNLWGLYDSKNKEYYKFNHWTEGIEAYKNKVEYRYKEGEESYYDFLTRIGYATDPQYIKKVQNVVENNKGLFK